MARARETGRSERGALAAGWLAAGMLWMPVAAVADVASDRAAAILVYPKILVEEFVNAPVNGVTVTNDTIVQISNTSDDPVSLWCFYTNANGHCSVSGLACNPKRQPACPEAEDACLPGWTETDFYVQLTPRQPLAWRASRGLGRGDAPLDGVLLRGIGGASNAGTQVPPVAAETAFVGDGADQVLGPRFVGELRCIVVDQSQRAVPRNVVKGEATIVTVAAWAEEFFEIDMELPTVEKYSAIGIQAIEGDANEDKVLELGGESNEYNGCANVLIVDHFFDAAILPLEAGDFGFLQRIFSNLVLVPCSQDFRTQGGGRTVAQYLVFNEFEQRLSTSAPVDCYFDKLLSTIDTRNPSRSIFDVGVAGTLVGQTRIRGVQGGLIGLLQQAAFGEQDVDDEIFRNPRGASVNVHLQGSRAAADRMVLP